MKFIFFLLSLLFPLHILACKCDGEPTLKSSFKNATFVFIGEIYDITEVPSGFKTSQNILSKVKINTIYKSDYPDDFYTENATLIGSPLNSCHVQFKEKGKYLIFAYSQKDTDFLYSDHCFVQKKLQEVSPDDLKELQKLSNDHLKQLQDQNTPTEIVEIIDKDFHSLTHTNKKLRKEISKINDENKKLKVTVYSAIIILIFLIIILILFKRKIFNYNSEGNI
ncbi:hypothetical protein SAMN05421786_102431 [Chryseobacterium ureilyticum]|uniref:Tissue inhibitor of metalloproteinase n=1 Tax=Chryseobacterium ureilyticum TaxID=373668 RepID=A0A1N7MB27_9FLAO|nr:hypothetical protein [Chryseobacterium ureilyticum]SIS83326.1 hypothetical protein SAMN05421786_102431 [Chryseobacterium ureilyticum]